MTVLDIVKRFFRAVRSTAIFIVMFIYVSAGIVSAVTLYTQDRYRAQPLSALEPLIAAATQKDNGMDVAAWLDARPLSETQTLVNILTPKSESLGPSVFFAIFRHELKLGRVKEALFWLQLGRFRLRYDLLRCGATPKQGRAFSDMLSSVPPVQIDALLEAHPEELKESLQRVLDFDAKYPAADDPSSFCKAVTPGALIERKQWPLYRAALRHQTEDYIKSGAEKNTGAAAKRKNTQGKSGKEKRIKK